MTTGTVTLPTPPTTAPATAPVAEAPHGFKADGTPRKRAPRGMGARSRVRGPKGTYFVITADTFDTFSDPTKVVEFLQELGAGAAKAHVILGRELGLVMKPVLGEKK